MKGFLITLGVVALAAIVGYVTFDMIDEGTSDDTTAMISRLITSIVVASVVGVGVVVFLLPYLARLVANALYDPDSGKFIASTHLDAARSKKMQGEFDAAIVLFRLAIEQDEPDRLAWVEIAQIQLEEFEEPETAIATLKEGHESNEWEEDDDINFQFRMAEIYLDDLQDRKTAVDIYKRVIKDYPGNDHYINQARATLYELGVVV